MNFPSTRRIWWVPGLAAALSLPATVCAAAPTKAVSAGGEDAAEKAGRLAEVDPGAQVAAISAGLDASKDDDVRWGLLQQLLEIKTDAATAVLRREVRVGKDLRCRVESAQECLARGATDIVPALVAELRKPQPKRHYDADLWADDPDPLIKLLGACGDLRAMKALAARQPQLTADLRGLIVEAALPEEPPKPIPAEVTDLGEKLAVSALDDRALAFEPFPPEAGNSGGMPPEAGSPRVCDLAAAILAQRWPDRYPFHDSPLKLERDAQIAAMRNIWRSAHGLKALPAPEFPAGPAAHDDANAIAELRWIGGSPVAGFPEKMPQRDASKVKFALKGGQPLTGKDFMMAIDQLQQALQDDFLGFAVSAERLGDQRGLVVEIEPLGRRRARVKHAMLEFSPKLDLSLHTAVDGKSIAQTDEGGFDGGDYFYHGAKHAEEVDAALQAPADAKVGIYFQSTVGQ